VSITISYICERPLTILSWERFRGVSKPYDPDLDYKQRIEEMRKEWEVNMQEKYDEKNGRLDREDFE
jgi:hypothetical protein